MTVRVNHAITQLISLALINLLSDVSRSLM